MTDGREPAVVTVQYGPGAENAFGAVAQAYSDRAPVLFLPTSYPRGSAAIAPNFESSRNYRHVTKWCERAERVEQLPQLIAVRLFTPAQWRTGTCPTGTSN